MSKIDFTPEKTLFESPPLFCSYRSWTGAAWKTRLCFFIQEQAVNAKYVFSVCTGALICGAAGLFKGVRDNALVAFHLLEYFGAIPIDERGGD